MCLNRILEFFLFLFIGSAFSYHVNKLISFDEKYCRADSSLYFVSYNIVFVSKIEIEVKN